jgi:hypothetical protein
MSTHSPKFDQLGLLSLTSIAATVIEPVADAGEELQASIPLLPAATTTGMP